MRWLVIAITFFELLDPGLQFAHPCGGTILGLGELEKSRLDQNGQNDNSPTPIADKTVDLGEEPE